MAPSPSARQELLAELREALAPQIQVISELGGGGMGTVFLGRDPSLKRSVAIKVLNPELVHDEALRARFAREAEAAAAVGHPNVVGIYQVGTLPKSGASFFVMQFVEGESLSQAFPPGTPAPVAKVRRIMGEVAGALAAAHARGLVHRDIKPANVMLERETGRTLVLDFGISAVLERRGQQTEPRLTATGSSLGTPTYMSPEQASAEQITGQTDVYSLGCLAFELLAGRPPFVEPSAWAVMAAHIKEKPPGVQKFRSDVDAALADLVDSCLRKDPAERPTAAVLARHLLPPPMPAVEWPPPGLAKLHRSGRRLLAALAVSALATTVGPLMEVAPRAGTRNVQVGFGGLEADLGQGALSLTLIVCSILWVVAGLALLALAIGTGRRVASALRSGYPLRVAWRVTFDVFSDTAALLNGEGAYADLDPTQRDDRTRWRRRAGFALVLTAVLGNFVPWVWLAGLLPVSSRPDHPYVVDLLALLVPPALGLATAWYCARRAAGRGRRTLARLLWRRLVRPRPEVVQGWLASRGIAVRATAPARAAAVGMALVLGTVLVGLGSFGPSAVSAFTVIALQPGAKFRQFAESACEPYLRGCGTGGVRAESSLAALAGIPRDTAREGEAMALIVGLVQPDASPADSGPFIHGTTPAVAADSDTSRVARGWGSLPGGVPASLRDSLSADAADPRLPLWRAFAALRPADRWWPYDSIFRGAVRTADLSGYRRRDVLALARKNEAAAVLAAAAGDTGTASLRLRENVAVARNLWIVPTDLAYIGDELFWRTKAAFRELGRVSEASAFGPLADAIDSLWRRRGGFLRSREVGTYSAVPGKPQLRDIVRDTTRDPWLRYVIVASVVQSGFCFSPREMFFGVSAERADDLRQLAGLAQDLPRMAAFVDLNLHTLDLLRASGDRAEVGRGRIRRLMRSSGGPFPLLDRMGFSRFVDRLHMCFFAPYDVM